MASTPKHPLEVELRSRVNRFFSAKTTQAHLVKRTIEEWQTREWGPVLFGGFLRDLLMFGRRKNPRDIDVVLLHAQTDQIAQQYASSIKKRTRFGGVQLELNRWHFDVWPLAETWAFKHIDRLKGTIRELPDTTFLNVEAVAVTLTPKLKCESVYFSEGFFEGISKRYLDINLEENPYPDLAAVRALITAAKLEFRLSRRLASYIVDHIRPGSVNDFVDIQRTHYASVRLPKSYLLLSSRRLQAQLSQRPRLDLLLPFDSASQLSLW